MAKPKNTLPFRKTTVSQTEVPPLPELTDEDRDRIHAKLQGVLAQAEAEGNEMDQVLQEIRRAAHPEIGLPPPKAWADIRQRHPSVPLPNEPNLSPSQEWELAKKLRETGRLKRVRSKYWNPWAAQDQARFEATLQLRETIHKAYGGKLGAEEWKVFRRKHRGLHLPKTPKLTLKEWFDALDMVRKLEPRWDRDGSLYSLIKWRSK